jgi:hypothetical protein
MHISTGVTFSKFLDYQTSLRLAKSIVNGHGLLSSLNSPITVGHINFCRAHANLYNNIHMGPIYFKPTLVCIIRFMWVPINSNPR